jgi:hypothetical protein
VRRLEKPNPPRPELVQASYTCLGPNEDPNRDPENDPPLCGKPSRGRSLCATHLRRWQRNGTLERRRARTTGKPLRARPTDKKCSHPDGCDKPYFYSGWCGMHYNRVYVHGDPGPVGEVRDVHWRPDGTCRHKDGCPRPNDGTDGWCRMHAERIERHGHPGPTGQIATNRPYVWGQTA